MELQLIEKGKDFIRIQFSESDMTLINPLIKELLADGMVEEVKYSTGHPDLDAPTIFVKVNGGKPQTALKRAAKNLSNQFREAREKLVKELK